MRVDTSTERPRTGLKWITVIGLVVAAAFGVRTLVRNVVREPSVFRSELAQEFLGRYVDGDGRVVRRDQGSDTVSEGQAYTMLLAVALDDPDRFSLVWEWTKRELQRPDGLLSWHWSGGRVADPQPASDADVDAAYALVLAAERFGNPSYLKEARRIGDAILGAETAQVGRDRVLLAGPWARDERVVNPSYVFPEAFRRFANAFGDDRWRDVLEGSVAVVQRTTADGRMPPDWAGVGPDGTVTSERPPGIQGQPSSGLDAARVPIRFASSCDESERDVAAGLWPRLRDATSGDRHAAEIVAAAAAAHAAGEADRRDELLDRAEELVRAQPSYYGWALVALGPALLDPDALRSCPGLLGGG